MKNILYSLAAAAMVLAPGALAAAERTATIEVTGLYCSSCPYIAAQAITAIDSAEIIDGFYDAEAQMAQFVIRYDDELTDLDELVTATMDLGYPARLIEQGESES